MKPARARFVDPRGFAWPLAALERKREHEVDCAAASLAAVERAHAAAVSAIRSMEAARAAQLQGLSLGPEARVDPALRGQALRYLACALETASAMQADATQALGRVDAARRACADAQRGLESVLKLRNAAWDAYVQCEQRRQARMADAAWLAHGQAGQQESRR